MPRRRRFSWEGMQVEVPTDWDPVVLETSAAGGFCRLEDAERFERLTVKWNGIRGTFNLDKNFRNIVKAVEKGARRRARGAAPFQFRPGATIPGAKKALRRFVHQTFAWSEGELLGWGVLLFSDASRRATVLQINGQKGDERLAGQVLGSFRDPQPGPNRRWEMHGLAFETGTLWSLAATRYDPRGVFRLDLKAETRTHMTAMRWSLANMWLKHADMQAFFNSSFSKERRRYNLSAVPREFLGHPAVHFERALNLFYRRGRAWLRGKLRIGRAHFMHGVAWHCEPSNRIFVLSRTGDRADAMGELMACAQTMRCCEGAVETAARQTARVEQR